MEQKRSSGSRPVMGAEGSGDGPKEKTAGLKCVIVSEKIRFEALSSFMDEIVPV